MALDPTKHADWEIAQDAEKDMLTIYEIGEKLGLQKEELLPHGHYFGKLDYRAILDRQKDRPDGKYVDVTAISPTPLGEGKSTCVMGLVQGLGQQVKIDRDDKTAEDDTPGECRGRRVGVNATGRTGNRRSPGDDEDETGFV